MDKALIIGYGKLGSHLYYALKRSRKIKVTGIIKSERTRSYASLVKHSDIIFICVQDSKIKNVVKNLLGKEFDLKDKYIFHTSGSLTSDELLPLEKKGSFTASFHPVQTFESRAKKHEGRFKGIYTAIEGQPKGVEKAATISKLLGSYSFIIDKESKVYHHICCVMASGFLAAIARGIEKLGAKKIRINGFKNLSFFNIYMPLASQTLSNIASKGAVKSLSGPAERNDISTIKKHLNSLNKAPADILGLYILLGIETAKLAFEKKSINRLQAEKIFKAFVKQTKHLN